MFTKALSAAVVALASSTLVSAQTFTACNPLKKTCPNDPAFGDEKVSCDFTKGACDAFHTLPATTLKYDGKGANFIINKEKDAPTVATDKYIFFGRIDVVVQAANGQGIVTSAVLQSDDLDEIDWEWVGGDNAQVQTNYFSKGDTSTYDRGRYHGVDAPLTAFHTYSIEWTPAAIVWYVDGVDVRTETYEALGDKFPQTPMQVKLGTWVAGGKDTAEGTVQWAGGYTDFDDAPFNAYYKSISIVDYAGKSSAGKNAGATEYVYSDNSGDWQSIKVVKGDSSESDKDEVDTATRKEDKPTNVPIEPTKTSKETKATKTTSSKEEEETTTTKEEETSTKEEETKTTESSELPTTLATASKSDDDKPTETGSDNNDSASTSGSPAETPTTVRPNSGTRVAGNMFAAVVAFFAAQLLI